MSGSGRVSGRGILLQGLRGIDAPDLTPGTPIITVLSEGITNSSTLNGAGAVNIGWV